MELKMVMRSPKSLDSLRLLCKDIKAIVGDEIVLVEIGSYMGESSEVFAQEFPKSKIICIDPWESGYDSFDIASNSDFKDVEEQFDLRMRQYDNIVKIKQRSSSYFKECDVVYIDGCHKHECVKEDIMHWLPQTRQVIAGHDYKIPNTEKMYVLLAGVRKAVDEIIGLPEKLYGDGSWYKRIKNVNSLTRSSEP